MAPPTQAAARTSTPPATTRESVPVRLDGALSPERYSPDEMLVRSIVESSNADLGWIAWRDQPQPLVILGTTSSAIPRSSIGEFPDPPEGLIAVDGLVGVGPWALWCRTRGIRSCLVAPIAVGAHVVGVIGLASSSPHALKNDDLRHLRLASALSVHAWKNDAQLAGLRRLFDEVSRTLEGALALDRALRQPPSYRELARSIGEALDATYCQIAIRDSRQALTIRAAGGHRPPRQMGVVSWPLSELARCSEALRERRAVVLTFRRHDPAAGPERLALFSATTSTGVILPFFASPRTQGVLIIGEERHARAQALSPERVAILELVASRIAHILRITRRLEYERLAERRRQQNLRVERQRLAREVHDQVGQALTGLLAQVRGAISEGQADREDLQVVEQAARSALDGARALAYGIRHIERGIGSLEEARNFAELTLRAAHCRLSWAEERAEVRVPARTLREIGQVIKECATNIVRHARADMARIRIEYPDGLIRVIVQDNGVGYSPNHASPSRDGRGLGLVGSSERLARVGGVFDIRRSPKGGTIVLMEAPR